MTDFSIESLGKTPFFLGEFLVDAPRSSITVKESVQSIEPKVMQVLLILAANNGKVVSQETLYAEVWQNSVFSPGSIRRCIAILRKVLGEEHQELIKTFSKKGYALNAKITLQKPANSSSRNRLYWAYLACAVILLVVFLLVLTNTAKPHSTFTVREATPVTYTEALEFNGKVSPEGSTVAFLRVEDTEKGKRALWIKELATDKEQLIVDENVLEFDWSSDSDALVFTTVIAKTEHIHIVSLITQNVLRSVASFDNEKRISAMQWGLDGKVYTLAKANDLVTLVSVNINSGEKLTLRSFDKTFVPYEISLHKTQHKLALAGFNPKGVSQLFKLPLTNEATALSETITLNENRYFLAWHPNGDAMVISDGRLLSVVSKEGNVTRINYDSYDFVQYPQFTPAGDQLLFSLAQIDADIAQMSLTNHAKIDKLVDSNTVDSAASLSPDKSKVAFISLRKGFAQVYVLDLATQVVQLVYKNDERLLGVSNPVWNKDGTRLGFSNYDFPVVISFKNDKVTVKQLTTPYGVLVDFYPNSEKILTLARNPNQLSIVDLAAEKTISQRPVSISDAIVDANEQICFVQADKLFCLDDDTPAEVLTLPAPVLGWVKSGTELLFTMKTGTSNTLLIIDLKSKSIKATYEIPAFVTKVLAITNGKIIYESEKKQKDIILLKS